MNAPSSQVEVQVLLFARFAELLGTERLQLRLEAPATVRGVLARLRALPRGAALPTQPLVALNQRQVALDASISDGDEVAVLPPLAGG